MMCFDNFIYSLSFLFLYTQDDIKFTSVETISDVLEHAFDGGLCSDDNIINVDPLHSKL